MLFLRSIASPVYVIIYFFYYSLRVVCWVIRPCRDVSEVPYLHRIFYDPCVLLCDAVSTASSSILLGRLTLEGQGATFRQNVGSHSRTFTVFYLTKPATRIVEPRIVRICAGYMKKYEFVELMCMELFVD